MESYYRQFSFDITKIYKFKTSFAIHYFSAWMRTGYNLADINWLNPLKALNHYSQYKNKNTYSILLL